MERVEGAGSSSIAYVNVVHRAHSRSRSCGSMRTMWEVHRNEDPSGYGKREEIKSAAGDDGSVLFPALPGRALEFKFEQPSPYMFLEVSTSCIALRM